MGMVDDISDAALTKIARAVWTQEIGAGASEQTAAVDIQRAASAPSLAAITAAIQAVAGTTGTTLPPDFEKQVADQLAADLAGRLAQ